MIYLTSNPDKMHEAKEFFDKKHGLKVEILNPNFEPVEIQAETCAEVVAYTVKDAAERLGKAVVKSDAGFYVDALGGLPGPYSKYFDKQIVRRGSSIVGRIVNLDKNQKYLLGEVMER